MGMMSLSRLMSEQRDQKRRRKIQAYGSITSASHNKDLIFGENDNPQCVERSRYSGPNLPEDIWCHILSLIPLRDSARSACVYHTFLRSWRCHPKLTFTEEALGLKQNAWQKRDISRGFISRVDHILKNHLGVVKILELVICDRHNVNACQLNSWFQNAFTPGIKEVSIILPNSYRTEYNFPCSVLINGRGDSIQYLHLTNCSLRPTDGFNCLRSMTKLHLYQVRITGDELRHLIANSFALEHLELSVCHEIICLNIPHWLVRLRYLQVFRCKMLQVVECTAPNLSTFHLFGDPVQLTLCESSKVKNVNVGFSDEFSIICYAINKFPSIVPNLETLTISSAHERVNTPVVADKFLHLKYLKISLRFYDENSLPNYDYLSLASFLDASPVLETFILSVNQAEMKHDSVLEDAYHTRHIRQRKHERLSEVQINGFCSAKSIVDLTCHILENATSLESLTVDTIFNLKADGNISRCSGQKSGECRRLDRNMILEAHKALCVIRTYILKRVPPTVEFNVGEPCSRCHAL